MKLDRRSLILLLLQLAIVSTIAAKYLYQRQTCPRVWVRAVAYDPELVLRGRYLSMQLHIDACGVTFPPLFTAKGWEASSNVVFDDHGMALPTLEARIGTANGNLVVTALNPEHSRFGFGDHSISLRKGAACQDATLLDGISFYIPERARSPFPLKPGSYLWVEVTVPPKGPPRPLNLALNDHGHWQPLSF